MKTFEILRHVETGLDHTGRDRKTLHMAVITPLARHTEGRNRPSAAAGQASRQNSLRMAICDQRISRPDAQGDCVVKDNAVKLGPNLL